MEFNDNAKPHTDYSNTIIYKITCKDPIITDLYVGHTTNFNQRRSAHMNSCINNKATNHACKLYKTIRSNGGWSNWTMDILECFNCADQYDARKKEQEYYVSLNATLNSIEPLSIYYRKNKCKPSNINHVNLEQLNSTDVSQNSSVILGMERAGPEIEDGDERLNLVDGSQMSTSIQSNNNKTSNAAYVCTTCDFESHNKTDFTRHIFTPKHIKKMSGVEIKKTYNCNCGKIYKHPSGLCVHKKKCNKILLSKNTGNELPESIDHVIPTHIQSIAPVAPLNQTIPSDTIYELLKEIVISNQQNTEFKQIIVEQQAKLLEILGRTIT